MKPPVDQDHIDKLLAEYERAQEIGLHTDNIIHEVVAIVWGAETLLLGFSLDVSCDSSNQRLVIATAIVGIFMSAYVIVIHILTKKNQVTAFDICRGIESSLQLPHRLHTNIKKKYPHWKPGFWSICILTVIFCGAWIYVIHRALVCLRGRV